MFRKKLVRILACAVLNGFCLQAANLERMLGENLQDLQRAGVTLNQEEEEILRLCEQNYLHKNTTRHLENGAEREMETFSEVEKEEAKAAQEHSPLTSSSLSLNDEKGIVKKGLGSRVVGAVRSVLPRSLFSGGVALNKKEDKSEE